MNNKLVTAELTICKTTLQSTKSNANISNNIPEFYIYRKSIMNSIHIRDNIFIAKE